MPPTSQHGSAKAGKNAVRQNLAALGAFCFFLSTIEYMIPKPLPFMRIGIANLPLMLAVDIFSFPAFMTLAAVKILGQAIITGTLFSYLFLFSLGGTLASALSMYGLRRLLGRERISFIGIGAAGAMMSNISQLCLAWLFIFSGNVRYIAPPFLAAALITGIATGVFCELFSRRSRWYRRQRIR